MLHPLGFYSLLQFDSSSTSLMKYIWLRRLQRHPLIVLYRIVYITFQLLSIFSRDVAFTRSKYLLSITFHRCIKISPGMHHGRQFTIYFIIRSPFTYWIDCEHCAQLCTPFQSTKAREISSFSASCIPP